MKLSLIGGAAALLALASGCTVPSTGRLRTSEPARSGEAVLQASGVPTVASNERPNRPASDSPGRKDASPTSAREFTARGIKRAEAGRLDESIADFGEAIRLDPKDAGAHLNRAIIRLRIGRLDEALSDADEAVRLNPDRAEAFATRAAVRAAKGRLPGALDDYGAAIRLDPENAAYYETRSSFRLLLGDRRGALDDLDAVIRLDPGHAMAKSERESLLTTYPEAGSRGGK